MSKFDTFNEVEDAVLRTYNRAVFVSNVNKDSGPDCAARYLNLFSDKEKTAIYVMLKHVSKFGYEEVKKEILKRINK